jgi:hypothetical protein
LNTPSSSASQPEFVQPRKAVLIAVILLGGLCVALSSAWDVWALPGVKAWIAGAENRADLQSRFAAVIAAVLVAVVVLSVALAAWFWVLSFRMYRYSVFPPQGYPVLVRTAVLRGSAAVRQAKLHAVLGALVLAACAFVVGSLFSIFPLAQLFWGKGG